MATSTLAQLLNYGVFVFVFFTIVSSLPYVDQFGTSLINAQVSGLFLGLVARSLKIELFVREFVMNPTGTCFKCERLLVT